MGLTHHQQALRIALNAKTIRELCKMQAQPSIYETLKFAGCRLSHHESDLYVKVDKVSRRILREIAEEGRIAPLPTLFESSDSSGFWWELPFAYEPWWLEREKQLTK